MHHPVVGYCSLMEEEKLKIGLVMVKLDEVTEKSAQIVFTCRDNGRYMLLINICHEVYELVR